jgi:hypothetical protein
MSLHLNRVARTCFAVGCICASFLLGACGQSIGSASTEADLAAPAPVSAYAFWNSIGVNTHLFYSNTPYSNIAAVAARLEQLGIVHIRDGLAPNRPDEIRALDRLASDGIRSDLLVGQPGSDPTALLTLIRTRLRRSVEAVEGPNEYGHTGKGWQSRLIRFQRTLYRDVRSILPGTRVVGASVGSVRLVGSLNIGNLHPYPGGGMPEANLTTQILLGDQVSGSAPVWVTETGYHDAVNVVLNQKPGTYQPPTTDAAQAIYLPRLFAYYFSQGIHRTYLYELLDEFRDPTRSHPNYDFGLLDHNLTPKPQFYALENLIHAVRDTPDPEPALLSYTIADPGSSLHQLLLARANGSWQILVWRAEQVNAAGQGATSANIDLKLPFCSTLTSESPSQSSRLHRLGTGTEFGVRSGAALQILNVQRARTRRCR